MLSLLDQVVRPRRQGHGQVRSQHPRGTPQPSLLPLTTFILPPPPPHFYISGFILMSQIRLDIFSVLCASTCARTATSASTPPPPPPTPTSTTYPSNSRRSFLLSYVLIFHELPLLSRFNDLLFSPFLSPSSLEHFSFPSFLRFNAFLHSLFHFQGLRKLYVQS